MLWKKKVIQQGAQPIGFTKQKKFLFFKIKSKPIYPGTQQLQAQGAPQTQKISKFQLYIASIVAKHKGLDMALRDQGIKESPYEFVKKMLVNSIIVSAMLTVTVFIMLIHYNFSYAEGALLSLILGIALFEVFFNKFIQYPIDKSKNMGKEIEKSILFAARDLVISMRSGMPLFNALTTVSTGYGAASKEFAKIVELVQLGMPMEQAIDEVSSKSQSKTFKSLMLQASVSIKAGADIVGALQGVVDEVMQERIIELRRYGQRLNAMAMFYMLFGVIFPSMGIAVAAILTTFISIFTVDESTLIFALVGIFFLQLIFLNLMRSSRPTFAM
jgi:flagellar protein FlaJ